MGLIEALSHPSKRTRRLLELALTWENGEDAVLPPPPTYRTMHQLTPIETDELVADYRDGASVYDLARKFGIHRITVGKRLRAHGINTKPPALTPIQRAEAADLYQAGWSLARIGKYFKVSADSVSKYLVAMNVTMRRPWERLK